MLLAALAIVIEDPKGGPIFTQMRAGKDDRHFKFYKFRSMCVDAEAKKESLMGQNEATGPIFKMQNDPRLTKVGRFIRKTSIDELPQFWNVIKGDMSVVGPRPLPVKESDACSEYEKHRLDVIPGITCYWQCNGRSNASFENMIRYDFKYMRERSMLTDIKIIFKTCIAVLKREGAK